MNSSSPIPRLLKVLESQLMRNAIDFKISTARKSFHT